MPIQPTTESAPAPTSDDRDPGRSTRPRARSDAGYWGILYGVTLIFVAVCLTFLFTLVTSSFSAWRHSGLGLIYGRTWNPDRELYGALPLITGTLETSFIALLLAVPLGVLVAVSIVHLIPARLRTPLSSLVELLAAVPSVVYGMVGFLVLAPYFQLHFYPWLQSVTHGFYIFSGTFSTTSVLLAGIVLFVMILPTIVALSRDAIATVPLDQIEGAMSVGATRWQTLSKVVLPSARPGITGAVTLAAARALGETIAVAMVIGNYFKINHSLLSGGTTLASALATQWDGATALTVSALGALAVILIAITAIVNVTGRQLLRRANQGGLL
jgi:phosphate transport system permease protein